MKQAGDDTERHLIDPIEIVDKYLDRADWRVNANANRGYSAGGLILSVAGKTVANYWLDNVYNPGAGETHRNDDFHIHDLNIFSGYRAGWSLKQLLQQGFNGVTGAIASNPPKYFSSVCGQIVNFPGTLQDEWAGAQAFSSFDTYMTPFVRLDSMTYGEIKQQMQELIYSLNVPSRWGSQYPFTNLTFDWTCPDDLKGEVPFIGRGMCDFTYGDPQAEIGIISCTYMEIMTAGDANEHVFTFPIPTYSVTKDFDWDSPNADLLFTMTARYDLPYFQNLINSGLDPGQTRSMCCRLQLDLHELVKRGNGLFGSAEQTSSVGVVTINLTQLGYLYKGGGTGLIERLHELVALGSQTLEARYEITQYHVGHGLFPYTKRYLGTLDNRFSATGIDGMNEMIRSFADDTYDITDPYGHEMAMRILDGVRDQMVEPQEPAGHMYNLETTPAEGATYRLTKADRKRFGDKIIQADTKDNPYYTDSSQLPAGFANDPFLTKELQEELQTKYTGDTVLHLCMGEAVSSAQACKQLAKHSLTTWRTPYITITPTFSICPSHGYLSDEHFTCPQCEAAREHQEYEVWTRVMGCFHPVQSFNIGKKGEYTERIGFSESAAATRGELHSHLSEKASGVPALVQFAWFSSLRHVSGVSVLDS